VCQDLKAAAQRKLSFLQTMKAVAWGFFGVRKHSGYEEDASKLNPLHVVVAGVLAAVILVLVLIVAARWAIALLS